MDEGDYDEREDAGDENSLEDDYGQEEEEFEEEEREERDENQPDDMIIDEANYQPKKEKISTKFLTKYERARVLGARALQISKNAPLLVDIEPGEWDPLRIAEKELVERKIPFIIRRYLPDGSYEDWKLEELIFD